MSEILTNAAQLRDRFECRLSLYLTRVAEAKFAYTNSRSQQALDLHEYNRRCAITVVACYGDATNMTFAQARVALGVNQSMLDRLP